MKMRFPECLFKVRRTALLAVLAALAVFADEAPWNTYIVDRTVEVSPGARKNKAFPMEEGSALCDLHLRAEAPWRIRSSRIALRDDKTLWFKASDREYIIASGYAPNEYVVVRGELEKPGGGSGKGAEERPQFQVTVPKVDLQWAAKHGEASQEEKEDSVPAVIMVSEDPNDFGTLIVCAPKDDFHLSDPRVTLTWTHPDAVKVYRGNSEVGSGVSWLLMAGTQLELSVKAVRPEADVKFTLKGEPDVVSRERAVDYARAMCAKVEFVTPAGDPVRAPKDVGDGQNEFTFSTANPGVLTMNLKTRVTPAAAAPIIAASCRFEVDAVGTSAMAWAAANPRGRATSNGGFLTAMVAFTGLPDKNDAFGKKKAILLLNGRKLDESDYEVFFPRDARNKQAGIPNWMYYWRDLIPSSLLYYAGASGTGMVAEVVGMSRWNYGNVSMDDKTHIYIYDEVVFKGRAYGVSEEFSGIDMFVATVKHEECHIRQIRDADALLSTFGNDAFRFGWSWDVPVHNHWLKGVDGAWGAANVDDDGNGVVDDAAALPPFEPGHGDEVSLEDNNYYSWPSAWPYPNPNLCVHPIESEAVNEMDNAVNENDYAAQDWADPGKQHNTLNDWSD